MKKLFFLWLFLASGISFAQNPDAAHKLVGEGVELHDKGDFKGAIDLYDKALKEDKDNLYALLEKALTLNVSKQYDECILICKRAIELHKGDENLKNIYITYAGVLDITGKNDEAIKLYDEAITIFPKYSNLYYEKGIAFITAKKTEASIECFHQAMLLNPEYSSPIRADFTLNQLNNNRIPALLAGARFLVIAPNNKNAPIILDGIKKIMAGNAEKTGDKKITLNLDTDGLGDTLANGKPTADNFTMVDMILQLRGALALGDEFKKMTEIERFIMSFEIFASSLNEGLKKGNGFYWDFYAPYFAEMKQKKHIETFAYIIHASSEDKKIQKWLKKHEAEIKDFYKWSDNFRWKSF